jgi:hypothetical protein
MEKETITARCKLGIARFGWLDRIRILVRGFVYVATINGKAHTTVKLATRRPVDQKKQPLPILAERKAD